MYRLITLIVLSFLPLHLYGNVYWSQGNEENRDGATFVYADTAARLLWRRHLGDWVDRNGTLYGDQAFSTTHIPDLDTARQISLDVTDLVKYWLNTPGSYHGVYLKEVSGKGTTVFYASESGYPHAPFLAIHTVNNEIKTFEGISDTSLSTATHYSMGHQSRFQVNAQTPALLAFGEQFLTLDAADISKARLFLSTTDKQYGDTRIAVFAVAPLTEPPAVTNGIAWDYPADRNLTEHPAVILTERFDSSQKNAWRRHLSDFSQHNNFRIVDGHYQTDRFAVNDGGALQIEFNPKTNYGFSAHYRFKKLIGEEPEQLYFRYYLRLGNGWQPTDGGKLPGFAGTYNKAGWGGRAIDGYNGWSARGAYFLQASPNSKFDGTVPLGNYVYHLDGNSDYGETISWNSALSLLQKNRWYAIEQYLKLNDPGQANGQLAVWLDGRKIFDKTDLRFRKTTQLKIESLWLNFYHGGINKPESTYYVYIDNLVIASEYIGPMRK